MTTDPVGIGIGTPEPIPDGKPPAVAVGLVGGDGEGMRVVIGAAVGVTGGGRAETGGDTGPKPGMLIGKHFASRGLLTVYYPYIRNENFSKKEGGGVGINVQRAGMSWPGWSQNRDLRQGRDQLQGRFGCRV